MLTSIVPSDLKVPVWFASAFKVRRGKEAAEWMRRNRISEESLRSRAYAGFLVISVIVVSVDAMITLFLGTGLFAYLLVPSLVIPLIIPSLVMSSPQRRSAREELELMRESPTVMGAMSMSMQLQPSLDRAVAFASQNGEGAFNARLRAMVWQVLTRVRSDLPSSMIELASTLSEQNENLRQSIHLMISATQERTREGMDRLLDKANALVIDGVKDRVDRYVASLAMPTMVFFAFGILLPVMMFSLVPLLTMGSVSSLGPSKGGEPIISDLELAFLLLVVFPLASFAYARSTLERNPLRSVGRFRFPKDRRIVAFIAVYAASMIVLTLLLGAERPEAVLLIAVMVPSIFAYSLTKEKHREQARLPAVEKDFVNALYQIGNRMTTGASFDLAMEEVARSRDGSPFAEFARRTLFRCVTSRKGMSDLIAEDPELKELSPLVRNALMTVAECASSDPQAAGKVALNLAQYLGDLRSCQSKIREKLQSVVEMMGSTATIFAPIVLGITGSLFALVGSVAPGAGSVSNMTMIGGIYVVELTLIVSYFTTFLLGGKDWDEVAYRFFTRAPVSVLVFISVSAAAQGGLMRLL